MTFKKLALASAIAMVPAMTFAAESLDDASMSAATGQDGIQIALDLAVTTDTIVHDTNGINAAFQSSYTSAGAIVIQNMAISATNGTAAADGVIVQIDAGDSNASTSMTAPVLNVNVAIAGSMTIATGSIGVANSRRDDGAWGVDGAVITIMNTATIILGNTVANIQLGNEPQGAMIKLSTLINGGITILNSTLNDANSGGTIGSASMNMIDNGGANLTVSADIDVTAVDGLRIRINQLGDAVNGMDIRIVDQYLGTTTLGMIGDVEMQRVNLAGTVIGIRGKN